MSSSSVHCSAGEAGPWACLPDLRGALRVWTGPARVAVPPRVLRCWGSPPPGGRKPGQEAGWGRNRLTLGHVQATMQVRQWLLKTQPGLREGWQADLPAGSGPPSQTSSFIPLHAEGVEHDSSKRWRLFLRFPFLSVGCIPPW